MAYGVLTNSGAAADRRAAGPGKARWFTPRKFSPPARRPPRTSITATSTGVTCCGVWAFRACSARSSARGFCRTSGSSRRGAGSISICWRDRRLHSAEIVPHRAAALKPAKLAAARWALSAASSTPASGGGWGPVVDLDADRLSSHAPRQTVGSVNTTEFFVTVAAATTFFVELGASPLQHLCAAGARRRSRGAGRRLGGQARLGAAR